MLLTSCFQYFLLTLIFHSQCVAKIFMNSSMSERITANRPEANKTLSMIVSINYSGWYGLGPIATLPMEVALKQLSTDPTWLPGYNFSIELIDDQCSDLVMMEEYGKRLLNENELTNDRIPLVMMGYCPGKALSSVGNVLQYYNFNAIALSLTDKSYTLYPERFSSLFQLREVADFTNYQSLVDLMVKMNWNSISIFSEDDTFFNAMEDNLVNILENSNITLNYLGPKMIGFDKDNVDEVERAFQKLAEIDARIIMVHTGYSVEVSCWLHRYGLYGPNYVIIGTTWGIFDPEDIPVPSYLDWCTTEMIKEVVENWMYFGIGYMYEVYGDGFTDSLGFKFTDIVDAFHKHVVDSNSVSARDVWWPEIYDPFVVALKTVGKAEEILNRQFNSTLSEWTANPQRNVEANSQISAIFKEAIYKIDVNASIGHYNFDKLTQHNTNGFKPITFYQPRYRKDGSLNKAYPVSYYDDNTKTIHSVNGGFLFSRTKNIPKASAIEVEYEVEMVDMPTFIVLSVVAAFVISIAVFFIAVLLEGLKALIEKEWVSVRFQTFKWQDIMKLIGLIVLLSSVFATPHGATGGKITTNYACQAFLLSTGLAMIAAATIWKIEKAKTLKQSENQNSKGENKFLAFIWLLVQIGLIAAFIANRPFSRITTSQLESYYSDDKNTVFRPYRYQYGPDFLRESGPWSFGLFISIALSNVLVILLSIFEGYRTLSMLRLNQSRFRSINAKTVYSMEDFKMMLVSLIFSFILFCAIILIGLISMTDPNRLVLVTSVSVIIVSFFTISVEFASKFKSSTQIFVTRATTNGQLKGKKSIVS